MRTLVCELNVIVAKKKEKDHETDLSTSAHYTDFPLLSKWVQSMVECLAVKLHSVVALCSTPTKKGLSTLQEAGEAIIIRLIFLSSVNSNNNLASTKG